ncbi:ATP-grasp domain-containing protein [Aquiflexum balticum DSM 16537]|uniref:ATP-grasp domain-containing protein n=1 Tax=Aquiflexum balticum DSM 16537 TaxID=758820 RepID=A0A1W2HAN9_9BACT|nr:ATP-grasp domain-containing protein [Aquiflexum balticum]SMD45854.1 ATP-grasp domain-containing protein [Aquiflexum balticum DSM 16537]
MILLDYPYTSDFLIDTVVKNQFPVVATKEAKEILQGTNANLITEEDAIAWVKSNPLSPVYTNSENSIAWIQQNLKGTALPAKIEAFKNKFKFRELIQEAYPDYFFKSATLSALANLDISDFKFPFIIKPAVGFFSIAVHKVDKPEDWPSIVSKIEKQMEKTKSLYPKEVVSNADFIIEEYIHGEEYAFDCYFDEKGEPVILNVLHHVFTSEYDVSDRVYSSSEEVIKRLYQPIMDFLQMIGSKIDLRNFPLHIEFRESEPGKINPIEVNPMRFGGWCTTADLTWFSYGINSYEYFFNSKKPDWNKVFEERKDKKYSLILLDNQSDIAQEDIAYFDFDAIAKDFEHPIHVRNVNMDKFGVFGFLFTETSKGNERELEEILHSDLKKYMVLKG